MTRTAPPRPDRPDPEVEEAFDRLLEEGHGRLTRPMSHLISTTLLGGIDVGTGVLAYLLVEHETHNPLLAGLAFSLGFVALLLARSELFTENFLVPVTAVAAGHATLRSLLKLWGVALAGNLVGGWVFTLLITNGETALRDTAVQVGSHYAHLGYNAKSLCLAILAGAVMTLMTRMQHATESLGVRIVPAILFGFLLSGGQLFHSILDSLFMFAGLQAGHAPYGYLTWFGEMWWAAFGNLVGGLVLVTAIRFLRVPHRIVEERRKVSD